MASMRSFRSLIAAGSRARAANLVQTRGFAKGESDVVVEVFKQQQQRFRALMEEHSKLKLPLDLDAAGLKAYVASLDDIKRKLGIPSTQSRIQEAVDNLVQSAYAKGEGNMRTVLKDVEALREKMSAGDSQDCDGMLMAAMDKVEADIKGPLMLSDKKGMTAFKKEVAAIKSKLDLGGATLAEDFKLEEAKHMIASLKAKAVEDMETAKRREGLSFVTADLKQ
eukprot:CAMPEP_0118929718 /NCGR_PEP_ID=MMETSP1169-20130426/6633_1 /TAXON_ID=36882 /ORGANISM="Pyramimonas obovata, Strain CCMP722" /LENGTH=222 /DNA_ID=CAMNT_0006871965 /DNA_START=45 /DNA_END=713 /DNA_ORIENTATION=-